MTPIHHITHIDNLPRILREGGLVCDAISEERELCTQSIAHRNLKERRKKTSCPVGARGVLADYVPFYFTNRSPMLYAIHKGGIEGYSGGQRAVVYLVCSAEAVAASDLRWCFTDGHAVEGMTGFHDDLDRFDQIDWPLMTEWSWRDTMSDPDRKRRKQAEFLIHDRMPWNMIESLAVIDVSMQQQVKETLQKSGISHCPPVRIESNWYYNI